MPAEVMRRLGLELQELEKATKKITGGANWDSGLHCGLSPATMAMGTDRSRLTVTP